MSRIVIALGGNSFGLTLTDRTPTMETTAKEIVDFMEAGHKVVVTHGNGPQVGAIYAAMNSGNAESFTPLHTCGAMSQAYMGHVLQNAIREELVSRGMTQTVATIVTHVEVDGGDSAFQRPTKPIGRFFSKEEADRLTEKYHYVMTEDSGRGYRRCVPSPKPIRILELDAIAELYEHGAVTIACGGGGIPVVRTGNSLQCVDAVIDKDLASALLAENLGTDRLIILTGVDKVSVNFRKPDERQLDRLSPEQAEAYIAEGQFAPGSMLPKIRAAVDFARSGEGRAAIITSLGHAKDGFLGLNGTLIR